MVLCSIFSESLSSLMVFWFNFFPTLFRCIKTINSHVLHVCIYFIIPKTQGPQYQLVTQPFTLPLTIKNLYSLNCPPFLHALCTSSDKRNWERVQVQGEVNSQNTGYTVVYELLFCCSDDISQLRVITFCVITRSCGTCVFHQNNLQMYRNFPQTNILKYNNKTFHPGRVVDT